MNELTETPAAVEPPPVVCDYCRQRLDDGDAYYHVSVGMDNAPNFVGDSPLDGPLVEETSDSITCASCEPSVSRALDALLTTLWGLRRPDATAGLSEPPHSVTECDADPEVDTERLPCPSTAKT